MSGTSRYAQPHMNLTGEKAKKIELSLPGVDRLVEHLFEPDHVEAINFAIASGRPLLCVGEPGVGKTQLAIAAAKALGRVLVRRTLDARVEPRDLLYHFDAVARLADAQIAKGPEDPKAKDQLRESLHPRNYLVPGPLWWGFCQGKLDEGRPLPLAQCPVAEEGCDWENGAVVCLDEIDKAESDVPNALLEALGEGRFTPDHYGQHVTIGDVPPLVIVTSNGDKKLPPAFLRRCLVLAMKLPKEQNREALVTYLADRGDAHVDHLDREVLELAAETVVTDRIKAHEKQLSSLPGLAEYIDLVTVLDRRAPSASLDEHKKLIETAAAFLLNKAEASSR